MGVKISELAEKATANSSDVIPIVDTGTKKITKANLLKEVTNSIETINTKLTNLGNYSTEEVKTGETWIDGKPIYRKVVSCGALPNSTVKVVAHNISNIDNSRIYGFAVRTSDKREFPLPFSGVTLNDNIQIDLTSTQIQIRTSVDRSTFNATYIIVEYTKTTD